MNHKLIILSKEDLADIYVIYLRVQAILKMHEIERQRKYYEERIIKQEVVQFIRVAELNKYGQILM